MPSLLAITQDPDLIEAHVLCAMAKRGFNVKVLLSPKARQLALFKAAAVPCEEIHYNSRFDLSAIRTIRRELAKQYYDIVHCFVNRSLSNALVSGLPKSTKLVAYRGTMGHLSKWSPLSWMAYLNPRVDKIVCVSKAVREYLSKMVPANKLITIYKGHDPAWYAGVQPANLSELGIPKGAFVVSCLANIRPVKGVPYLLEAIRNFDNPQVHLILIGHLDQKTKNALMSDEKLSGRIHALGFRSDAWSFLAASSCFAMVSVEREGLSKATIEAMSLGVTPIVTNVGGLPEVVESGASGVVVPPRDAGAIKDAILKLYGAPSERQRLALAAQTRVREFFNISQTIELTYGLYQELAHSERAKL
ncbi:MAG: glycosyltransferase family 4 protein [Oligoflexia bacterium]|nr:glycosyltransferase family 4 protein [Oligoflexia bacterium]